MLNEHYILEKGEPEKLSKVIVDSVDRKSKQGVRGAKREIVIAHFLFTFGLGGMESGVLKLVNNFSRTGFRHVIITLTGDLSLSKRVNNPSVSVHVLNAHSTISRIAALWRIIRQEKVDILHARGWPTMFEAAIIGFFYPSLISIFSFHGRSYEELEGIMIKRRIFQIVLARLFNQIITLTEYMQNEIGKEFLISKEKIKIVCNGVHQTDSVTMCKSILRSEFRIDENDFVVGSVGRADPVKGIKTILNAFDLFYQRRKTGFLLLVGTGKSLRELKEKASKLSCAARIIFTGSRDNGPEFMAAFDVYVQTSLYEGLSNTILEAMAVGLPVICTRVGGNIDLIKDGKNGYLIEKNDSTALADHIDALYHDADKRHKMGTLNRVKIGELYSIHDMISNYERNYAELLQKRK